MTHLTRLSLGQRASLATLLTLVGVVGQEVASFRTGSTPILEIGYFAIPAALALLLFRSAKQRALAFMLLAIIGLAGAGAAIYVYLTW